MKKIALIPMLLMFLVQGSYAASSVHGYTKKNGTHVQSYKRTSPNHTQRDNWSSTGNVNPYTGKAGTKRSK